MSSEDTSSTLLLIPSVVASQGEPANMPPPPSPLLANRSQLAGALLLSSMLHFPIPISSDEDEEEDTTFTMFQPEDANVYSEINLGYQRICFRDPEGVLQIQFCNGNVHWVCCYNSLEGFFMHEILQCELEKCVVFNMVPNAILPCLSEELIEQRKQKQVFQSRCHDTFYYEMRRSGEETCKWMERCDGRTHRMEVLGTPIWSSQCTNFACNIFLCSRPLPMIIKSSSSNFDPRRNYEYVKPVLHGVSYMVEDLVKLNVERCVNNVHFHIQVSYCTGAINTITVWDCEVSECAVNLCRPKMKFPMSVREMKRENEVIITNYNRLASEYKHEINFEGQSLSCLEKCDGAWHSFELSMRAYKFPVVNVSVCANELCNIYRNSVIASGSPLGQH